MVCNDKLVLLQLNLLHALILGHMLELKLVKNTVVAKLILTMFDFGSLEPSLCLFHHQLFLLMLECKHLDVLSELGTVLLHLLTPVLHLQDLFLSCLGIVLPVHHLHLNRVCHVLALLSLLVKDLDIPTESFIVQLQVLHFFDNRVRVIVVILKNKFHLCIVGHH